MSDTVDALDEKALQAALEYLRKRPNAIHEVCRNCERQAAEIESLRTRLEEEHKDAMKWSGIAGAYTNKCNALTEKVERYREACQAMAEDGWLYFGPEGRSTAQQKVFDVLAPEPSKAQPSEDSTT